MLKILANNCNRETINYIVTRYLWINQLFIPVSPQDKNSCLTINCRTKAEDNFEQFCYHGQNKKDKLYNKLLTEKKIEKNDCSYCSQQIV